MQREYDGDEVSVGMHLFFAANHAVPKCSIPVKQVFVSEGGLNLTTELFRFRTLPLMLGFHFDSSLFSSLFFSQISS